MKKVIKLYTQLCDEYINKNIQRYCSLQSFLQSKYDNASAAKKNLLQDVINYAAKDFPY